MENTQSTREIVAEVRIAHRMCLTTLTVLQPVHRATPPLAVLGARFVVHMYRCPDRVPAPSCADAPTRSLAEAIDVAVRRARLPDFVLSVALLFLLRLKARLPELAGVSGLRLVLAALVLAAKIVCDEPYNNKTWCKIADGMISLVEVNSWERELCRYLEWSFDVDAVVVRDFDAFLSSVYGTPGPYPLVYPLLRHWQAGVDESAFLRCWRRSCDVLQDATRVRDGTAGVQAPRSPGSDSDLLSDRADGLETDRELFNDAQVSPGWFQLCAKVYLNMSV